MDATKAERFVRAVWKQVEAADIDALIEEVAQELSGGTSGALKISLNADFWHDAALVARGRGLEVAAKAFFKIAASLKFQEVAAGPGGRYIFPGLENTRSAPHPEVSVPNYASSHPPVTGHSIIVQNTPQENAAQSRAKVIATSVILGVIAWLAGWGASASGYFYESVPYYLYVGGVMIIILGIVFAFKVIED